MRDLLREKKERLEAAALRDGVLEDYRDILDGKSVEFKGSLRSALGEGKEHERSGW